MAQAMYNDTKTNKGIDNGPGIKNKQKAIVDFTYDLISKLHLDYLLLNRICYKVKHQYRKQKQFQYVTQYKKSLLTLFRSQSGINPSKDTIAKELFIEGKIASDMIKTLQELVLKIGALMLEMLKLKLYPSYTIIIFGIMSRSNAILDYLIKNKDKISKALASIETMSDLICIN